MTNVERMFRLLVTTMTSQAPERLTQPFEVADLYQNILPYRLYRRELGLETNQDYELTLMELLSGAENYLVIDDRMRDVLGRELASPTPDAGAFRQFATTLVSINPDALAHVAQTAGYRAPEPVIRQRSDPQPTVVAQAPGAPAGAMSASTPTDHGGTPSGPRRAPIVPSPGESCRFCGGRLPEGRPITYCPHCGQDLTVLHCDACGTELEVGWKFCTTCGRKVAGS